MDPFFWAFVELAQVLRRAKLLNRLLPKSDGQARRFRNEAHLREDCLELNVKSHSVLYSMIQYDIIVR